ncbi:YceI family protein [Thalassotalea sp. 1_MG-2023]|uniref:YceI family protein n=1 Tax=Thalassotalea sp. 1_MG-2023 TaxID=3062680 RepID=UPI0026E3EF61|nr:YceI family protein [Thalassotalea sp. 1_MG-2023]MDO6425716.1 YceI family protein [Thalassotalea sp. 1_MG-2023]
MKKIITVLASLLMFPAMADWQLNTEESSLIFTSIKKEHIAENHNFGALTANISNTGAVELTIDLASVNTNIPIRDQRMGEHLFATKMFPKATFTSKISPEFLSKLKMGEIKPLTLTGEMALHDNKQKITAQVNVSRLAKNKVVVTSVAPILIKAQDFALVKGINKLQELAGLPSISHTVPVVFTLSFTR